MSRISIEYLQNISRISSQITLKQQFENIMKLGLCLSKSCRNFRLKFGNLEENVVKFLNPYWCARTRGDYTRIRQPLLCPTWVTLLYDQIYPKIHLSPLLRCTGLCSPPLIVQLAIFNAKTCIIKTLHGPRIYFKGICNILSPKLHSNPRSQLSRKYLPYFFSLVRETRFFRFLNIRRSPRRGVKTRILVIFWSPCF